MIAGDQDDRVRQLAAKSFPFHGAKWAAYWAADLIKLGWPNSSESLIASLVLEVIRSAPQRYGYSRAAMLRLIADADEGKTFKGGLSETGQNIVRAWIMVVSRKWNRLDQRNRIISRTKPYYPLACLPTLSEVKTEYVRMILGEEPPRNPAKIPGWLENFENCKVIPSDGTFRRVLGKRRLWFLGEKPGPRHH
jgi:hypothetical protein